MIQLSVMTAVVCGAVLALLVGGAGYALFVGRRLAAEADDASARVREAEALRSVSPALPMLVRAASIIGGNRLWVAQKYHFFR